VVWPYAYCKFFDYEFWSYAYDDFWPYACDTSTRAFVSLP